MSLENSSALTQTGPAAIPALAVPASGLIDMGSIKSVAVYCGSSPGNDPIYMQVAADLGRAFALNGVRVVYGGGSGGLMGTVARSCVENGGKVLGILPTAFVAKTKFVGETILVEDMHTRKLLFNQHCDAFISLPGGYGTAEELFEAVTWAQLEIHAKPVLVLNLNGFYTPLLDWIKGAVDAGFISRPNLSLARSVADVTETLGVLAAVGQHRATLLDAGRAVDVKFFHWDGVAGALQRGDDLLHLVAGSDGVVRAAGGPAVVVPATEQERKVGIVGHVDVPATISATPAEAAQ
ncbi:hypothetical protein BC828DRAFT_386832 [Blastocladiella britannica]|nr:hypothetical protein BC828DRAFT_386832 [Blastocladiella britannica]